MKSKKVITLSLSDLKDLGVLPRKNKKKNKKRKRRVKVVLVDPNTGAIIGGAKSDSSHMQGYAQSFQAPQFTNTANISSAIQEENLKAIERANRKALTENQIEEVKQSEAEQPKPEQNQLLLGYLDDRFSKVVENNNNLFGSIVPKLQRIENDNQQQKIINQQGFNMIQNLAGGNSYYDITDNVGFNNSSVSSDTLQDQGNAKPIETTQIQSPPLNTDNRFNITPSKKFGSVSLTNDYDDTGTPSIKQQVSDINKLFEEQDEILRNTNKAVFESNEKVNKKIGEVFGDQDMNLYNSPQKKALSKIKSKSKLKKLPKYITPLSNYILAGGDDNKILESNDYNTIERAYKNLIKNK